MTNQTQAASPRGILVPLVGRWSLVSSLVVATGIVAASLFGLLADHPYRGFAHETIVAARAQDVCSVLVAGLLLAPCAAYVARGPPGPARPARVRRLQLRHLPHRAPDEPGLPRLRRAGLALGGGVPPRPAPAPPVRLATGHQQAPGARHRLDAARRRGALRRAVAQRPAALRLRWVRRPHPQGPGGVAYPVFVLDLVVVLPAIAAVGVMLLRGRPVAGPLTAVALVKIVTLFAALWAGVLVEARAGRPRRAWRRRRTQPGAPRWSAWRWSAGGCARSRPTRSRYVRPQLWW